MLKSNILAGSIVYTSISQTDDILNSYFEKLDKIMKKFHIVNMAQTLENI